MVLALVLVLSGLKTNVGFPQLKANLVFPLNPAKAGPIIIVPVILKVTKTGRQFSVGPYKDSLIRKAWI